MYEYRAKPLRIVDGDTVHLEIDLGLETSRKIKCRLYGINAPEMNTLEGKAARAHLEGLIKAAIDKDGYLRVSTIKDRTEKYGRYLVMLSDHDGNDWLNNIMVANGHAMVYMDDEKGVKK